MQEMMSEMEHNDEYYMGLAVKEAKKGIGRTAPNPCVGAVIVKDGREISRGFHKKAGEPHAEINAIKKAGGETVGSTIYVTLEPCNHTGKTPPCSKAIVTAGISRVVVGMEDPNPLVDGRGIDFLRKSNIEVVTAILEEQCQAINEPFIKRITTGLPLVAMKAGISLDGKITYQKNKSGWITGPQSLMKVHQLRDQFDAIMIGRGTLEIDDPSLTTRLPRGGRDPLRVIIDSNLSISPQAKVLKQNSTAKTWIFCCRDADRAKKAKLLATGNMVYEVGNESGKVSLREVLQILGDKGVNSVLVEGGATIHGAMLAKRLVDKAYVFQAPLFAGDHGTSIVTGLTSSSKDSSIKISSPSYQRLGEDLLISGNIDYPTNIYNKIGSF